MATTLLSKPEFRVLQNYPIARSISEIYTKLNNHHGDQFGKCKITTSRASLRVAQIQIINSDEHQELKGVTTLAIWGDHGHLKIKNAYEGKTILRVAMLLIDHEELPSFLQKQET